MFIWKGIGQIFKKSESEKSKGILFDFSFFFCFFRLFYFSSSLSTFWLFYLSLFFLKMKEHFFFQNGHVQLKKKEVYFSTFRLLLPSQLFDFTTSRFSFLHLYTFAMKEHFLQDRHGQRKVKTYTFWLFDLSTFLHVVVLLNLSAIYLVIYIYLILFAHIICILLSFNILYIYVFVSWNLGGSMGAVFG